MVFGPFFKKHMNSYGFWTPSSKKQRNSYGFWTLFSKTYEFLWFWTPCLWWRAVPRRAVRCGGVRWPAGPGGPDSSEEQLPVAGTIGIHSIP